MQERKYTKNYHLKQVGITTDDKVVVEGFTIFKLMETMGIPLDLILEELRENEFVVDWIDFIKTGLVCGWSKKTILTRIEFPIREFCGDEVFDKIRYGLEGNVNS